MTEENTQTIEINVDIDVEKKEHLKALWRKNSKTYYERNIEKIRAKNLERYHKKKNLPNI